MTVVVIGDNTGDDYSGTEDTKLREGGPTTNYGTQTTMETTKYASGDHTHSCLSFSGISNLPSSITVSSSIISMYLDLDVGGASAQTVTFRRFLVNWVEAQATWNIYSTGNNWTTAGGLSDGNDRSATTSDTTSGITSSAGIYYDSNDTAQLSTDIENFASGSYSNYGWHVERTDGADDSTWRIWQTSENTDGQRPYITITYTTGGGAAPFGSKPLLTLGVG